MTKRGGKERLNGADLETHCFTTHTHTHTHTQLCSLDPYVPCCHGNAVDGFPACSAGISIYEHSLPHNCISCKTHTFHCVSHFVILTRSNPAPSFNSRCNNKDGAWGRCEGTEAVTYLKGTVLPRHFILRLLITDMCFNALHTYILAMCYSPKVCSF